MNRVVDSDHTAHADRVRAMLARYAEIELLLKMGEYAHGSDPLADESERRSSHFCTARSTRRSIGRR